MKNSSPGQTKRSKQEKLSLLKKKLQKKQSAKQQKKNLRESKKKSRNSRKNLKKLKKPMTIPAKTKSKKDLSLFRKKQKNSKILSTRIDK